MDLLHFAIAMRIILECHTYLEHYSFSRANGTTRESTLKDPMPFYRMKMWVCININIISMYLLYRNYVDKKVKTINVMML